MCVYIYMCVYMCVCMYVYIHMCVYTCAHTHSMLVYMFQPVNFYGVLNSRIWKI